MSSVISSLTCAFKQSPLHVNARMMIIAIVTLIGISLPTQAIQAAPLHQVPDVDGPAVPGQVTNRYLAGKIGEYGDLTMPDHHAAQDGKALRAAASAAPSVVASDEFVGTNLTTDRWSLVNPLNDGWITVRDGQLTLALPRGASHDPWQANRALRVMQAVSNGAVDLEVKFASVPTTAYQMQGIVLEQDAYNGLRFEVQHDGLALQVVAIATIDGVSVVKAVTAIDVPAATWLRVNRQADSWQLTYSADGTTWTEVATFDLPLVLTAVGPYVANHAEEDAAPAFTAQVEYFRNAELAIAAVASAQSDTQAPLLHGVQAFAEGQGLTIRWHTDEQSSNVVEFGPTAAYGQSVTATGDGYSHQVTIPGLTAGQTYHYRIVATDSAANRTTGSAETVLFTPNDDVGPTINVWYGDQQSFGLKGRPQAWLNVLGNVSDPDGVVAMRYTLNNATTSTRLSMGPDNRRLANAGDFTVDIATERLQVGNNTVLLTARDGLNNTSMYTVTVNYQPTVTNLPYTINWNTITNDAQIQSVAHSIDGKWRLENNKVRTAEPGYDRMIGFGDISWNDYEVLAPITIHAIPPQKNGIGMIFRWNGHTNYPVYCSQPKCGWLPLGVIAWWYDGDLELYVNGNTILASAPFALEVGKTYLLKARVETNPTGGVYSLKMWEESQPEPSNWTITGQSTLQQPQRGAPSFVVHRADVSLGNVTVTPVGLSSPLQNFPPKANADSAIVAPTRNIYIDVLKNDTDAGGLLDPSSVRIEQQPQHGTATVNTLTGQITYQHNGSAATADSFTYTVRDDGFGQGNGTRSAAANVAIEISASAPSVVLSDDFDRCLLNQAWEFVNPLGAGSYEVVGVGTGNALAKLTVPAGTTHNAWGVDQPNEAVRLMQPVQNSDFEIEVSFDTEPTGNTNDQGLLVEQDASNFIRFDVFHNGTSLRAFTGTTLNGNNLQIKSAPITPGMGLKLLLKRVANTWTMSNWDGTQWVQFSTFEQALTVTKVGVYAANAGGAAYSTGVDYLFDTTAPTNPEDSSQPNTLTITPSDNGSVSLNPAQAVYACNTTVELTAQPAAGFKFARWSGALSGSVNPNNLLIEGPATVTATFVLEDTDITPPVITLNGANPLVLVVGATYTDPGATATDDVDGDLTAQIVVGGDTVSTAAPASFTVTYSVTDASGNPAQATRIVNIVPDGDTTPPVITLLGANPFRVEAGTPWTDPGATAQDNLDGNLTSQIVIAVLGGGTVNTAKPAVFTITYDVMDSSGNEAAQVRRVVNVVDSVVPVITLNGASTLQLAIGATFTDPGATATDAIDGNITSRIVVGGAAVDTSKAGSYVITYNVTDLSGNRAVQVTRTVTVTGGGPTSFKVFMPLVSK